MAYERRMCDLSSGVCCSDVATVVVENVERVMLEDRPCPMEASPKSMGQITSALVGIGVVLSAVFIPMAFFPGSTGAIYRQFSLSVAGAMVLSVLVALILSPMLCGRMLKPAHHRSEEHTSELQSLMRISYAVFCLKKKK